MQKQRVLLKQAASIKSTESTYKDGFGKRTVFLSHKPVAAIKFSLAPKFDSLFYLLHDFTTFSESCDARRVI